MKTERTARRGVGAALLVVLGLASVLAGTATIRGEGQLDDVAHPKPPHPQEPSAWAADVDTLLAAIRRTHPDPYRVASATAFDSAGATLKRRLPSLPAHAASLEMQRLLAMAADGHTEWASLPESLRGSFLPIIFRRFEEGWFIRTGDPRYRTLFGKPITAFAGLPMDDAVERVIPYVSGENALGKLDAAADLLRIVTVLDAVGMATGIPDTVPVSVLEPDGSTTTVAVAVTGDSWVQPTWIDVEQLLAPDASRPVSERLDGNYECAWLPTERLLYVEFSEIRDEDDRSVAEFFDGVYEFARRAGAERYVLDLRENSGGNNYLNGPVLRGLIATPALDRPGRFFVMIGPDTYSAAMNLAVLLERHTHALFVGSPTGATPNHFGDTRIVELPGSGFRAEISELYWQNSDPRDTRPWITPDIPADPSAAALIAGRDPALEAVLAFETSDSLVSTFGPPMARWGRNGQLRGEQWPSLLEPAARSLDPVPAPEPVTEACVVEDDPGSMGNP